MANLYPIFIGFFILVSAWTSGSTADDRLSLAQLQEQFQQLKTNYEILEEKFLRLELAQLATGERQTNQAQTKNAIFRTCSEARTVDPSLATGMYWIDPDGEGVGDDPIYVSCDMATGKTSVLHDSESPTDVGHCPDPGCYSREIIYSATKRQMATLVELSDECHQSIKYDCYDAPLEKDGVVYSWWNDKDGNAQYFWAGSDSSVHTCQCGIDGNCIDSIVKCNCDATVPLFLGDSGVITEKTLLPITKLNFGQTQLSSSSGSHTLGRFECSGGTTVTGMPTSCEDLWRSGHRLSGLYFVMEGKLVKNVYCDFAKLPSEAGFQSLIGYAEVKPKPTYFDIPTSCANLKGIGHTSSGLYLVTEGELVKNVYCNFTKLPEEAGFQNVIGYAEVKPKPTYFGIPTSCANLKGTGHTSSGLYSVMGSTMVETVFCDFTKTTGDPAFQTWIGFDGVQSASVYFYVQRSGDFRSVNNPITFDLERINTGGAMNAGSGIFTVPVTGTYFFTFSGMAYMVGTTKDGKFHASLRKNGELIGRVEAAMTQGVSSDGFSLQSTLHLQAGEQIWIQSDTEEYMYLHDNGNHYTHFTGWLLQEDVAQSFKNRLQ
ncbi:uncharacterized protein LOC124338218 isoform X1 [Daphnia pulicaria]|uniref:uncharacterized protein LOC124338218 isoform X1 n=1 Tax=Daphnia pulicaria TaxID=35523 RepID=UPI001EE9ECBC|nr:uncharacterized protein LOC124338218 isoform X1 [Daphnia pulicaria]